MARKRPKRYFGSVRELPSGRFQARYQGPDGRTYNARTPEGRPLTFDTYGDADAWLSLRRSEILRGAWLPPKETEQNPLTLRQYATAWLEDRDLADTTREHYEQLLTDYILPTFGDSPVTSIKPAAVREWHTKLLRDPDRPTTRAHTYGLLRTIFNTAISEEVVDANPCRVRGAGQAKRVKHIRPASLAELETIVTAIPARYKVMVMLAAWCALRFGELSELRRSDVDVTNGVLYVRRGVVSTKTGMKVKDPKSDAGKRPVNIPPHLLPMVKDHLRDNVAGRSDLLFPSAGDPAKHMQGSALYKVWSRARKAASREDLRFHDLRHTGAVLAASTGATLAELMARLGHSTPGAAMRYQHAAKGRDKEIAGLLSKLVDGEKVVPMDKDARTRKRKGDQSA
ncbi:hypothetical protein BJF85_00250 [Saccharomonospora sp. CUA-673]|uniref:tyrosine-type recombinase/integrase n=1 Tax=Saccharomonospora sp. CUA-673 TaxID=1904969 RepID=UPI000959776E|nr:site-specific integrase [Saccharomonospora sp. CUA-673]OLT46940.1 hypothetical protein BJF85_00250 [Saccharomonospora sp. CUA-673]